MSEAHRPSVGPEQLKCRPVVRARPLRRRGARYAHLVVWYGRHGCRWIGQPCPCSASDGAGRVFYRRTACYKTAESCGTLGIRLGIPRRSSCSRWFISNSVGCNMTSRERLLTAGALDARGVNARLGVCEVGVDRKARAQRRIVTGVELWGGAALPVPLIEEAECRKEPSAWSRRFFDVLVREDDIRRRRDLTDQKPCSCPCSRGLAFRSRPSGH